MRWLKHLTHAHADEQIDEILERHGAAAYGVYWLIIEDIAAPMEPGKMVPEATHSIQRWSAITHVPARVFCTLLFHFSGVDVRHSNSFSMTSAQKSEKKLLTVSVTNDGRVKIVARNILKYRDEYSKKSGDTPENVRTKAEQSTADSEQSSSSSENAVAEALAQYITASKRTIRELRERCLSVAPDCSDDAIVNAINRAGQRLRRTGKSVENPIGWLLTVVPDYLAEPITPDLAPDPEAIHRKNVEVMERYGSLSEAV